MCKSEGWIGKPGGIGKPIIEEDQFGKLDGWKSEDAKS